jgi:nucleoside-diphosphate-sugar epimerase
METRKVLVCGAGGFIGAHLVKDLKDRGFYVIGADLEHPKYAETAADEFHIADLRDQYEVAQLVTNDLYEIYQLAADMGGAGYIFTGENDADIMHNSATINLNIVNEMVKKGVKRVFYSSSACMYPQQLQTSDVADPSLIESQAYPADPDSDYGWEKLFSERLYLAYARNHGLHVRIARLHNIYGPEGSWNNGKEKSPAALCRKVAESENGEIEVWGPGTQKRTFLYIDECIKGIDRIMNSSYEYPLNLGSQRMISINDLAYMISSIARKNIKIKNTDGPLGVMGRRSHNGLIRKNIGWAPDEDLEYGLKKTYNWILEQVRNAST